MAINGKYLELAGKFARLGNGSGIVRMHIPASAKLPIGFTVREGNDSLAMMVIMPFFADDEDLNKFVGELFNNG